MHLAPVSNHLVRVGLWRLHAFVGNSDEHMNAMVRDPNQQLTNWLGVIAYGESQSEVVLFEPRG